MISAVDRYVLRTAVVSLLVCFGAFIGLYVVVDAFGRLDNFLREMKTWGEALRFMGRYYPLHIPLIFLDIAPFTVLMASLFSLARLEKNNELLVVKASGISLRRLMLPLIGLGLAVSCLMYVDRQWIIPWLAEDIQESDRMVTRKSHRRTVLRDLFLSDSSGTWFVVGRYDPSDSTCRDMWIITSRERGRDIFYATSAVLARNGLMVKHGTALTETGPEPITNTLMATDLSPDDFMARASHMRLRSYSDLLWILKRNPNARDVNVMLHRNMALPLVAVVIPLIGISIMFTRESTGIAFGVGLAIFVCFLYFVLDNICTEIARQGYLSPATGAWAPLSVFSAAAAYLFFTRIRT